MARLVILIGALLLAALPAGASNAVSLGYSEVTNIISPGADACASGVLIYNHDGSFENGYIWQYGGVVPPYYGAFGEAYDLSCGTVRCAAFWLSTLPGGFLWYLTDCYIWEGGIGGEPGEVVAVVTGIYFTNVPYWPSVGRNDVDMNVAVDGAFTIGFWPDAPGGGAEYFCAADENGPRGHPWTCIAPGIGYPSEWQDPAIVGPPWGPTKSMGCGVYFESNPSPTEGETWGSIKALYR
jgi:hypothetical protein